MIRIDIATAFVCLSVTALGACQSVPTSYSFDPTDEMALVVLAASPYPEGGGGYETFQRVNTKTSKMDGAPTIISYQNIPSFGTDALLGDVFNQTRVLNVYDSNRQHTFVVHKVIPGKYARISSTRWTAGNIVGRQGTICLADASPVFELAAGEINIIPTTDIKMNKPGIKADAMFYAPNDDPEQITKIEEQFRAVRGDFSDIIGEARVLVPFTYVSTISTANDSTKCKLKDDFEEIPQVESDDPFE